MPNNTPQTTRKTKQNKTKPVVEKKTGNENK